MRQGIFPFLVVALLIAGCATRKISDLSPYYPATAALREDTIARSFRTADQAFAPAREAEKLFIGRIVEPIKDGPANRSQLIRSETNRTSSAAGFRR